ncbi:MAG: transglutaminase-like cysteine peptidase [Pseudomonadota bacterium]
MRKVHQCFLACAAAMSVSLPVAANADDGVLAAAPKLGAGLFGSVERWVGEAKSELPTERFSRLSETPEVMDATSARKWDIVVTLLKSQSRLNQLRLVQQFVNSQTYKPDDALWGSADYWSSSAEFLKHGGDCEDFALTKYRALIDAGFPASELRLVLVEESFTGEQHAVLAANYNGRRIILDNRRDEIEDHELVSNYRPLYSMNAQGLWQHHDQARPMPQIAVATKRQ